MQTALKNAVVAITLLAFTTGCATRTRTIEDVSPTGIQQGIRVGDDVKVVTFEGRKFELEIDEVGDDSLTGTSDSGKRYRIKYTSIRWIEVKETGASDLLAGLGVAYLVLSIIGMLLFIDLIDDAGDD